MTDIAPRQPAAPLVGHRWWTQARDQLDVTWRGRGMRIFMLVVLAHWAEHIVQAAQVFVFGWARPDARGVLGWAFPWLVSSEALHYAYAVLMLAGLIYFRPGFSGTARVWWNVALVLQIWHHAEHALLLSQVLVGHPFFGAAKPTSIIQLLVPRIELHLFYNAVVTLPMLIAVELASEPARRPLTQRAQAR
jgi:hypothetical protein